ncbi:hypothetical protein A3A93_04365 [Candidatus Roizmanbacteria bacterium RIFCSPLOWO2_01_FULL_38_12]|uniref:Uncharacterized protein n=1 Tax=Candidatus Roizmanbacteria bacterium RIFCSPLOWO2_01_FULL_38_12 TaxID=1802061 RepID=A0A1F7IXC3_9BACT|nr:MAG: hypothetical protein A2861_01130 [Candidatus Roizmanbacteria bacterium RIFCSPHIGHO2_01_FULL_38_15]OGK35474.1 MAG: hypothetical protein A3F59_00870 [Candidatus Roizmanbacteria bacterium RIFCSPHIGHO2_12_FULL_38_13]OGK48007.1 MAG: hypothetical protein A3A93_04365 [Candidatus Roizmanbacteria bacterium RIFCSPLOWO2_01_FULL_38_12]
MENRNYFHLNSVDEIIFIIISWFICNSFLLWIISNILHINDLFLWFLTIPVSIFISYFASRGFYFQKTHIDLKSLFPYLLLSLLLVISAIYLFEPILKNPYSTIGIPNKDLHDGIAAFIEVHGYPPSDQLNQENAFIPNSQNGLYLGYPNGMHVATAFLNKMGIFEFHSSWIVVVIGLLISSLSIFLISKLMQNDIYYSAVISGLFSLSSFRIAYAIPTSISMLYSYTIVLPCFLIVLLAIYNNKNKRAFILSSICFGLLVASYSGTIILFLAMIIVFSFFLLLKNDRKRLTNSFYVFLFASPFVIVTLFFQKFIYWQNTFPTAADFDPFELSQRLPPGDKPIYMILYIFSLLVTFYFIYKDRLEKKDDLLKIYLLVINLGFLLFIPYDLLFHYFNHVNTSEQLVHVNPDGIFGGLNHQKISRLSLLQPFFFIFFLGEFVILVKNNLYRISILLIAILACFFIRVDIPLYQWIAPEVAASFYNQKYTDKSYTLLSHLRLVVNDEIWSKEIINAFDYLRSQENRDDKVLVWDDRKWTEETITGWGSVYLKYRLLRRKDFDLDGDSITPDLVRLLSDQHLSYLLLLHPTENNLQVLVNSSSVSLIEKENEVYLFKIQN